MTISSFIPDDLNKLVKIIPSETTVISGSSIGTESNFSAITSQTENLKSEDTLYLTSKPTRKTIFARIIKKEDL